MAMLDYRLCDVCSGKAFYDAALDYNDEDHRNAAGDLMPRGCGSWAVLCVKCAATHETQVVPRVAPREPGEADVPSTPMPDRGAEWAVASTRQDLLDCVARYASTGGDALSLAVESALDAHVRAVRDALLASGTPLWVATDRGASRSEVYGLEPEGRGYEGEVFVPREGDCFMELDSALTPPGTSRRAVLIILPEEGDNG